MLVSTPVYTRYLSYFLFSKSSEYLSVHEEKLVNQGKYM